MNHPYSDDSLNVSISKLCTHAGMLTCAACSEDRIAELEQEIKEHEEAFADQNRALSNSLLQREVLEQENAVLKKDVKLLKVLTSEVAEYEEAYDKVINEKCPSDEKHCTCVPILRRENAALKFRLADACIPEMQPEFHGRCFKELDELHDKVERAEHSLALIEKSSKEEWAQNIARRYREESKTQS